MTDMRRTLLWGVFLVSLFLIYDAWNKHTGQPSLFAPPVAKRAAPPAAASGPADVPVASGIPTPGTTVVPGTATPAASAPVAASQRFDVSTDLMKVTLDSVGGDVVRVELLKQVDDFDKTKNVVLLDHSSQRLYKAQTGLTPSGLPNHLTPMTVVPGERALKDGSNELQVRLESAEVGGTKLVKVFTFRRGSHVIGVRHEVVNASNAAISPQLYLQLRRDGNPLPGGSSFYSTFTGPAVYTEASKFQKIEFSDIADRRPTDKPDHDLQADNGWVGMVQHYFASAWLLGAAGDEKRPREFYTRKLDGNEYVIGMIVPLGEVAPGTSKAIDTRLFVGPQEEAQLERIAPGLELVKDYGVLTILAKPLFWLLTEMHKILANWGWAIVALVVLLKIAFYWLNASAYRSMAKMKAIGPKVQDLRERFKDKPQQMQQEMMRIYREEKVNPLGGCLPILVQMPFFIALYWVLLSSVEMRHAPWIGWITDLSARDPYFILPILMTVTSMIQVALGAKPPDPMQARMMWIMPLAFSVMFFFFPAGLVLYWLTNNILSIAQQALINKRMGVLNK
jgi:YidC/Oxa1 family membrane protein insertase